MRIYSIIQKSLLFGILISLFFSLNVFADSTYVAEGTISGQTWTKTNSPYLIQGDIFVASLNIDPGVEVIFLGNYEIEVAGVLTAVGTEQDSIRFTKIDTTSGWQGIFFNYSSPGSELAYCIIEKSKNSGIRIDNSSPYIRDTRIVENTTNGYGGGINTNSNLNLVNCEVINNSLTGTYFGGGIYNTGTLTLTNCNISNNYIYSNGKTNQFAGGGIYSLGNLFIYNSTISVNRVNSSGGGAYRSARADGGGMYVSSDSLIIKNTIISGNIAEAHANTASEVNYGGGIHLLNAYSYIENCIISRNEAGGRLVWGGSGAGGGGIYLRNNSKVKIINSTIAYNEYNGVKCVSSYTSEIQNSIVYFNTEEQVSGNILISYSNMQNDTSGVGNINVNPIFFSEDSLTIVSPSLCIDAGDSSPIFNDLEDPTNPGFALDPSLGTIRNDMGAHGGPGAGPIGYNGGGNINPPVINSFTADTTSGYAPLTVNFEVQASVVGGSIVNYFWDFNGDGLTDTTTSSGTNSNIYNEVGIFNATCRVSDDQGAVSAPTSLQITVIDSSERTVSVPDASASADSTFILPIQINDVSRIAGAEFKLTYDPAILEATNVSKTDLTINFSIADSVDNGSIAITMANDTGLALGSGDILNISFHVLATAQPGDTSALMLEQVALYDAATNLISSTTENGLFTVGGLPSIESIFIQPGLDTLSTNETTSYSAFGVTTNNDTVNVDVNWSYGDVYGTPGGIGPVSGHSTVFTASGPGDGYITAAYPTATDTLVATASVIVGNMKGDVNIDEQVNVPDAILCLQIGVGSLIPSLYQEWAADFDDNGDVDVDDVIDILIESLNGLLGKANSSYAALSGSGPATIHLGKGLRNNDFISFPLVVENRLDACGIGLEINYNESVATLADVSSVKPSSLLAKNLNNKDCAKISAINMHGLADEAGQALWLHFKIENTAGADPDIDLTNIRLFDQKGNAIEALTTLVWEESALIPAQYELHQNFPNPFNPETTIQFDLPQAAEVSLAVYNVTGQLINSLVNSKIDAGSHSFKWAGNDNSGNQVTSGVYFYRINVNGGEWQHMKKMLFVK